MNARFQRPDVDRTSIRELNWGHLLGHLAASHGLTPDPIGRIVLRATVLNLDVVRDLAAGTVPAALDLEGSTDARERRAGLNALAAALDAHRG
ncbi:hypothetical protein [Cellulomonas hominis]